MKTPEAKAPERAPQAGKRVASRLVILSALVLLAAGAFAWWQGGGGQDGTSRKVLYYQDSMHPWIKSAQPGKCTVCAMDLTPIYDGEQGVASAEDVVVLGSNSVTVLNVQTEQVAHGPLCSTVRAAGTLEADNTRKTIIGAPAPGRIDEVAIESAGAQVERGQVLASFYSPDLSFQTRRYIFRDRINTREDMTDSANRLGSSRHAPRVSQATSSHPVPATEQADPFYNDLLSPQSGTIVERNVYDGQYVAEGDRLFVIVDLSVLWFRFDVYEQQLAWLTPGQEIEVVVPAVPGRTFKAAIVVIEPSFLDSTRTAKVRAVVENPLIGEGPDARRLLQLGMYAEARVRAVADNVLAAPRSAILFPGSQAYAYLDKGHGAYEMRQVEVGRQGDTHWEIISGLEAGERVVTSGNVLIDAQAQFARGGHPAASEAAIAPAEAEPTLMPFSHEQQQALKDFLAVADGISASLASDSLKDLRQQVGRLPAVVLSLSKALESDPAWHDLTERVKTNSQWPELADLAAARKAFLPFATNVVELVEQVRARDEAFQSLKVFFCPMAPKPGLWFQAAGPLRNPYYGAEMLSCGEEVKPKLLAKRPAHQPALAHSATGANPAATSSHQAPEPAMARPAEISALTGSQAKSLELLLTVADGMSQALAADELAGFQRNVAKLPVLLPVLREEFPASHAFHPLIERLSLASKAASANDLAEARKTFLPLSTNIVELVQQLRRDEPGFQSLKVFVCSMAPPPGLWFQARGPLRNPYFGAKMLTCGEEVAVPAKESTAVASQTSAPRAAESKPAARQGETMSRSADPSPGMDAYSPIAQALRQRLAGAQPANSVTSSIHGSRAAHYTNSAGALRSRMAHLPVATVTPQTGAEKPLPAAAAVPGGVVRPVAITPGTQTRAHE